MGDAPAGTSLLRSHADIDQRDRIEQHAHQHRHRHSHSHRNLYHRQLDSVVAEVTSTVSVIAEIIVDQNGNTQGATTLLAASATPDAWPINTTVFVPASNLASAPTDTPPAVPDGPSSLDSAPTSTDLPAAATSNIQITPTDPPITPTDLPILATDIQNTSIDPSVSSLITAPPAGPSPSSGVDTAPDSHISQSLSTSRATPSTSIPYPGTNSSSSPSSSVRSIPTNLSNYTLATSIFSSSTISAAAESVSWETSTLDSSASSTASSGYAPNLATATIGGGGGGGVGPGATDGGSSSTNTAGASAASVSTGTGIPASTSAVVGGVVGGIAGIVFVVALLMVIVRWRKRQQRHLRLSSGDSPVAGAAAKEAGGSGPSPSGAMTERPRGSLPFAIPASLATLARYKHAPNQPSVGASSSAGSEAGFVRVSGRKLPSVFQHGGDGFDDPHMSLSGSSFYRDSRGFYGGPGSPVSPGGFGRDSGIPVTRPSPARTPVISEGAFGPPSPVTSPLDPPRRPDVLGRSHPSRDGSHGSKFMEDV